MEKIIDAILTALGVGILISGWQRLKSELPKPTQDKQVTRVDYLSGNYERELRERDRKLTSNRRQGAAFLGLGTGFLVAGLYLLAQIFEDEQPGDE
ncbi:MAG: hypothetical protein ACLFN5_06380 [bacterium]